MKRKLFYFIIAAVMMIVLTATVSAYEFTPGSNTVVFVSNTAGVDTNSGATASQAVKTIGKAYTLLAAENGGTLVVCGKVSITAATALKAANGAVLITSLYDGIDYSTAENGSGYIGFSGTAALACQNDTYFDNITLKFAISLIISGRCNNMGFGAGVNCVDVSSGGTMNYPMIVGGYNNIKTVAGCSNDNDYTLTVAGGKWQGIMGGNRRVDATNSIGELSGDVRVIIEGGTFDKGTGSQYVSASGANYHTGRLYMEISGGTFNEDVYAYRKLGTLPTDGTIDCHAGNSAQTAVRITGGTFNGGIFTANESYAITDNDADITFFVTGGKFTGTTGIYNRGTVGNVLFRTTPAIEATLRPLCNNAIAFSNDLTVGSDGTISAEFSGKLNDLSDPWVVAGNGKYYYVFSSSVSVDGTNRAAIKVSESDELLFSNFSYNSTAVFNSSETEIENCQHEYWAPELIHFDAATVGAADAGWYIYFAADNGTNENHRMYVLKASVPEDPTSPFTMVGQLVTANDKWAIDGTVMTLNGQLYFVWSGWEGDVDGCQKLYIQPMSNPYTMSGSARTEISTPTLSWETVDTPSVNEGPEVLQQNGTTTIIYSAAGSWGQNYCLGMLTYTGTDPMNAASWTKSATPLFRSSTENSMYGTGHASFVQNKNDNTWWIFYHGNLTSVATGDWWSERSTYIQQFAFTEQGGYTVPSFGTPLAASDVRTITLANSGICTDGHKYNAVTNLTAGDITYSATVCEMCGDTVVSSASYNGEFNVTATGGNLTATVEFTPIEGATSYRVYRGTALLGTVTEGTFTDIAATAGTHIYKVEALYEGIVVATETVNVSVKDNSGNTVYTDVNGDGEITILDAAMLIRDILNGTKDASLVSVLRIMKHIAGLIDLNA